MTRESKIREISANLRLAALDVEPDIKEKLIRVAQELSNLNNTEFGDYSILQDAGYPEEEMETKPGRFDIHREPNLPLWNIQILRVRALNGEDAHNIVQQLVKQLQDSGHIMAAVGEIKPSTDQINPKGK